MLSYSMGQRLILASAAKANIAYLMARSGL